MRDARLHIGNWQLEPHANLIFDASSSTKLEHRQVKLLLFLIANTGHILTKQNLLDEIWVGRVVVDDVVAVAISRLRKALNDQVRSPQYIKTIPGIGYQFIFPVSQTNIELAGKYYHGTLEYPEDTAIEQISPQESGFTLNLQIRKIILYLSMVVLLVVAGFMGLQIVLPQENQNSGSIIQHDRSGDLPAKYQQARQLRNSFEPKNTQLAIDMLQDIITQSPDFADAYVLLAQAKRDLLIHQPLIEYHASEELKALIEKALKLDPHSSFAHETLGLVLFFVDWNHAQARIHLEKAIELGPENADAHYAYGLFLLAQGEFEKSHVHTNISRKLNPLNYSIASVAWIYAMQDKHEAAWQETEKLLALSPNNLQYHRSAYRLFDNAGDQQRAYQHLRKILELAEYSTQELAELDSIFAQQQLQGVNHWLAYTRKDERDIGFYSPPLSYARFAISAGEYEDAFKWLDEAYEQHQGLLLWLAVDPHYQPIRNDHRYHALLQKLGLTEALSESL